jgi:hypothetical protein
MKTNTILVSAITLSLLILSCKKQNNDKVNPVLTLNGKSTDFVIYPDHYVDPGATATDNKDGDITANITVINHLDYSQQNISWDIMYEVKDAAGNNDIKQRIVGLVKPTNLYSGKQGTLSWSDSLTFFGNDSIHIKRFAGFINGSVRAIMQGDTTFIIPLQTVICDSPAMPHTFSGTGTIKYGIFGSAVQTSVKINYTQVLNSATTTNTIAY